MSAISFSYPISIIPINEQLTVEQRAYAQFQIGLLKNLNNILYYTIPYGVFVANFITSYSGYN